MSIFNDRSSDSRFRGRRCYQYFSEGSDPAHTLFSKLVAQGLWQALTLIVLLFVAPDAYISLMTIPSEVDTSMSRYKFWIIETVLNSAFLMSMLYLLRTMFTDPGRVPPQYHWLLADRINDTTDSSEELGMEIAANLDSEVIQKTSLFPGSSYAPELHQNENYVENNLSNISDTAEVLRIPTRSVRNYRFLVNGRLQLSDFSPLPVMDTKASIKNVGVKLKWCDRCQHVRHPRTHHCRQCDLCIDRFDHHCVWVCNCVGVRNQRYFFGFVISSCVYVTLVMIVTSCRIKSIYSAAANDVDPSKPVLGRLWNRMAAVVWTNPICFLIFTTSILFILPLLNLLIFHVVLIVNNRTTLEEFREESLIAPNPYNLGWRKNIKSLLWSQTPPSIADRLGNRRVSRSRVKPEDVNENIYPRIDTNDYHNQHNGTGKQCLNRPLLDGL